MTDEQKIRLANRLIEMMETERTDENLPVLVGILKNPFGLNGFKKAETGHPVFEVKDRYIIFLESSTELTEQVYNQQKQGFEKKVGFFKVSVPFYKDSFKEAIEFN